MTKEERDSYILLFVEYLFPKMEKVTINGNTLTMSFHKRRERVCLAYHDDVTRETTSHLDDICHMVVLKAIERMLGTSSFLYFGQNSHSYRHVYTKADNSPCLLLDTELAYLNLIGTDFDSLELRTDMDRDYYVLTLYRGSRLVYVNFKIWGGRFIPSDLFVTYRDISPDKRYTLARLELQGKRERIRYDNYGKQQQCRALV